MIEYIVAVIGCGILLLCCINEGIIWLKKQLDPPKRKRCPECQAEYPEEL